MKFSQSGGHLSIHGITKWDEYDTVFAVETPGQQGLHTGVKASATNSKAGFPAANLTDGSHETHWDAAAAQPVSITRSPSAPRLRRLRTPSGPGPRRVLSARPVPARGR